jgi:hypothetical protein
VHERRFNLLVRSLAEIDQEIAEVEDPLLEPIDSNQVQWAVAVLCELHELRTKLEGSLRANEGLVRGGTRRRRHNS